MSNYVIDLKCKSIAKKDYARKGSQQNLQNVYNAVRGDY